MIFGISGEIEKNKKIKKTRWVAGYAAADLDVLDNLFLARRALRATLAAASSLGP